MPLAIQLHEGHNISLGKLLLAWLYHTLDEASSQLKSLPDNGKDLVISSPFWILQQWLQATFEYQLGYPVSEVILHLNKCRAIEGLRLSLMNSQ